MTKLTHLKINVKFIMIRYSGLEDHMYILCNLRDEFHKVDVIGEGEEVQVEVMVVG